MRTAGVRKRHNKGLRAQLGSSGRAGPGEKEERVQTEKNSDRHRRRTKLSETPGLREKEHFPRRGGAEKQKIQGIKENGYPNGPQDLTNAR